MADTPKTIDRFQVLSMQRKEKWGTVYLAYDLERGRHVALKLRNEPSTETTSAPWTAEADEHAELEWRFRNEGELCARLHYPSIGVDCEFLSDSQGTPFIVMDELVGQDLESLLGNAPPTSSRALRIASQTCSELTSLHSQQVIHRDIKPSNIWITDERSVRTLDLGCALSRQTVQLSVTGKLVLTLQYMAPEAISGMPVDHRSDLFSLGVVLYEILSGEKPFPGDTLPELMLNVVQGNPRKLVLRDGSQIPDELQALVSRALANNVEERFRTAEEMGRAIETIAQKFPGIGA